MYAEWMMYSWRTESGCEDRPDFGALQVGIKADRLQTLGMST